MKLIQKIKDKKQQLIRFLFGSFSATALMFVFQACYGMPQNPVPPDEDVVIMGTITDMATGQPVEGLSVIIPELGIDATTDSTGVFCSNVNGAEHPNQVQLLVNDVDGTENDRYETLDTNFTYDDLLTPFELQVRPHRGK